jgi:hypothetical protein
MADTSTTPLVLTSPGPGSVETGSAGNDTFYASQGNDTLTGGAGADLFVFKAEPWSPDHITDFQVGTDKLDLSAMFQQAGYTGSDPMADHYIVLASDGNGGTIVRFDHDGDANINGNWPNTIIDLEGVSPDGLTWSQLTAGSGSSSGGGTGAPPPGATVLTDGTYVQVTETADQQHVFVDHYSAAGTLLNEQRFDGMAYDAPTITPTTDAGYVIDLPNQEHATTLTIEKVESDGTVYQTTPSLNAPLTAQLTSAVTATGGGGFVVTANEPGSPGKEASFEEFNAMGQLQHSARIDGYALTATAEQGGGYVLSWDTFAGGTQSLTVDSTSSPDLTAPAAPDIVGYDHTTGQTFQSGTEIHDPNPTIELRVTSDEVGDTITNGPGGFSHLITQADLAQGTVALPEATPGADTYRLDKPDGVYASTTFNYLYTPASGGGTAGQVYVSPSPNSVETGTDGNDTFYASQGLDTLTGGAGADLFVFNREPWAPDHITDFQVGTDKLDLTSLFQQAGYSGSDPVADGYIVLADDGNGGTIVRFDHDGPGPNPQYPNTIIDLEGVSPSGLTWNELSVPSTGGGGTAGGGTPGQVFTSPDAWSVEVGTAGNDTFNASQGGDTLTGGQGADLFNFPSNPWAPITITDFTPGEDKLDLATLFQQAGYTGSDPIADHYITVESDGNGGSLIRYDASGQANIDGHWPNTIIDLLGVAPSQVSEKDWIIH